MIQDHLKNQFKSNNCYIYVVLKKFTAIRKSQDTEQDFFRYKCLDLLCVTIVLQYIDHIYARFKLLGSYFFRFDCT